MTFRKAELKDFPEVMRIINNAKQWMKTRWVGQWGDLYPTSELIEEDIRNGHSYVYEVDGKIVGTFALVPSFDAYDDILQGKWLTTGKNYMTSLRVAVDTQYKGKGYGDIIVKQFAKIAKQAKCDSVKITTFQANKQMQKLLLTNGYVYCGYIQMKAKQFGYEYLINPKAAL